ncbi:MAG: DUF420 domain-containing protein [Planctomycetota bacterium]
MSNLANVLPHVNAALNALATVLLIVGWVLIKRRQERAHQWTMLSAFGVSTIFLACYLFYHVVVKQGISTKFPTYPPDMIRYFYYFILLTHIVLAALVPVFAIRTIYLGLREQRVQHRWWARLTWPIWLYVSLTGVLVYVMLYLLFPPQ